MTEQDKLRDILVKLQYQDNNLALTENVYEKVKAGVIYQSLTEEQINETFSEFKTDTSYFENEILKEYESKFNDKNTSNEINEGKVIDAIKNGATVAGENISSGAKAAWDATKNIVMAHPAGAIGAAAAIGGTAALIHHLRKKHKKKLENRKIQEDVEYNSKDYLFSDDILKEAYIKLFYLKEDQVSSFLRSQNEDTSELLKECIDRYYNDEEVNKDIETARIITEEFNEYLQEDPILNEETLDEGKILNAIRWKLAKFSLRFLKEESLNNFLAAYYADKNGKITSESSEWMKKSRKEKIKKLRELADSLKEDQRQKIVDSQAAKQLERSGLVSIGTGVISLGLAGAAGIGSANAHNSSKELNNVNPSDTDINGTISTQNAQGMGYSNPSANESGISYNYDSPTRVKLNGTGGKASGNFKTEEITDNLPEIRSYRDGQEFVATGKYYSQATTKYDLNSNIGRDTMGKISKVSGLLSILASSLFGVMWGALIVGITGTAIGLHKFHQANVLRREDIMKELLHSKDQSNSLKEDEDLSYLFADALE